MSTLTAVERSHLEGVGIDPDRVGERLGTGAQNVVHRYGVASGQEDRVVKMPLVQIRNGIYSLTVGSIIAQGYDAVRRDLDTCAEYFEPFMVPTEVRRGEGGRYCIVQDMVPMQELTPERNRAEPAVHAQLAQIMEANRRMMREKFVWLDAMGWNARKFWRFVTESRPYLENVAVASAVPHDTIKLFDYGLFPMPQQSHFHAYYRLLLWAQQRNMAGYGLSFGGDDARQE